MKKLVLALFAVAAFAGSATAADLPARTYSKAPAAVAPVPTWTGCYIGGGGGYGMWNQDNTLFTDGPPRNQVTATAATGGRGYFGTVQAGCDYQFAALGANLLVGAFGDYDFGSLKANVSPPGSFFGEEKMSSAWSVGGRAGWLVTPSLLTFFSGGYTQATFDRTNYLSVGFPATPPFAFIDKQTYKGWYLGAGDEYALSFLPGLFWKTEYRLSRFGTETNAFRNITTGALEGDSLDSKKWVQTVRSELTYHFNWVGAPTYAKAPAPVVAPVASWTGCYVGGGAGYGLWNQENTAFADGPPRVQVTQTTTEGGRGYFGTVQGGCDYQFAALATNLVVGAFGDYDFGSLKANVNLAGLDVVGEEKMSSAWSVGGRAGWLVTPSLLTYFSGGYTEATFDRTNLAGIGLPLSPPSTFLDKRTYKGWFLGAGDEYALGFMPGLFWKTEYRFSQFDTERNPERNIPSGTLDGDSIDSKKFVHTVRSELTYHFNWIGPLVAKY